MATKSIRMSDGVDTLLPESAVIGSNANGYYTKFADGTLIQWGTTTSGNMNANETKSVSSNFAVAFTSVPTVVVTPATGAPNERMASVSDRTISSVTITFKVVSATTGLSAYWIAIGRWK